MLLSIPPPFPQLHQFWASFLHLLCLVSLKVSAIFLDCSAGTKYWIIWVRLSLIAWMLDGKRKTKRDNDQMNSCPVGVNITVAEGCALSMFGIVLRELIYQLPFLKCFLCDFQIGGHKRWQLETIVNLPPLFLEKMQAISYGASHIF